MSITRALFFLTMIVMMTVVGCGGGSSGGPVGSRQLANLDLNPIRTQAPIAANSKPVRGSVTQTSNTNFNGVTRDRISSTPSLQGNRLRATVRNGETTLGPSDIVDNYFALNRRVCQSCSTNPSGTSPQWQLVNFEKELSDGMVFSVVFSDIENDADLDYLSAGIWMYIPEEARRGSHDEVVYGTFAEGSVPFSKANLQGLTGEARYEGDAMGLYTEETSDTFEGVLFNATVELIADFGNDSEKGTIRGSVTGFSATNAVTNQPFSLQGTTLNLERANIRNTHAGFFKGNTSGSHQGEAYSGKWGGEFLGNGSSPTSVTGTFGAKNNNASNRRTFMGLFGAYRQ